MTTPFEYSNQLGTYNAPSSAPAAQGASWGSAGDWATILQGIGQGASAAMRPASVSGLSTGKKSARESKRRILANMLDQALKRNQGLSTMGQQHQDEMSDFQSQALQNVARGFVGALRGSTG